METKDFDFDSLIPAPAGGAAVKSPPLRIEPTTVAPKSAVRLPKSAIRKGEAEAESLSGPVIILGLEIIGFKRIRAVRYQLNREGLTIIGGKNGHGKSSNLEAVEALFGGARFLPDVPVHADDPEARTIAKILHVESERTYLVRRITKPDRSSFLQITRDDGTEVARPQEFLDAMTGTLWFKPLAFIDQPEKEKAETLRRLVGLDFSELDRDRALIYDKRTLVGRDRDKKKGYAESLPYHPDAPAEEATATDLVAQLNEANAHNQQIAEKTAKITQGRAYLAGIERQRDEAKQDCHSIRKQIEELQSRLELREKVVEELGLKVVEYRERLAVAESALAQSLPVDTTEIAERLTAIDSINAKVRENKARLQAFADLEQLEAEYEGFSQAIANIDRQKREQLASVSMPVEGLAFNEDGTQILFNEFPLSQASGAEQMRVATTMAMLMSGGLKVALVDEGERLDRDQLELLDQTVRGLGGQVLMCRVSQSDECHLMITDGALDEGFMSGKAA